MKKILALSSCLVALTSVGGVLLSEVHSQVTKVEVAIDRARQPVSAAAQVVSVSLQSATGQVAQVPGTNGVTHQTRSTEHDALSKASAELAEQRVHTISTKPTSRPVLQFEDKRAKAPQTVVVRETPEPETPQIHKEPPEVQAVRAQQAFAAATVNERAQAMPDPDAVQGVQLPRYAFQSPLQPQQRRIRLFDPDAGGLRLWLEARPSHELGPQVGVYR